MKNEKNRIKGPEGITSLMVNMWLRHKARIKQPENNAFWIDFPPLTEEEKAAIASQKKTELD